jgi:hypothetical protein
MDPVFAECLYPPQDQLNDSERTQAVLIISAGEMNAIMNDG